MKAFTSARHAALLALCLGAGAARAAEPAHDHGHSHGAPATGHEHGHAHEPQAHEAHGHETHAARPGLRLDGERRWATDEALRRGMSRIAALAHTPQADAALGKAVQAEISGIIAECKLKPEADAVLHVLIAELLAGAGALERGEASGREAMARALADYPDYFEHPGWPDAR